MNECVLGLFTLNSVSFQVSEKIPCAFATQSAALKCLRLQNFLFYYRDVCTQQEKSSRIRSWEKRSRASLMKSTSWSQKFSVWAQWQNRSVWLNVATGVFKIPPYLLPRKTQTTVAYKCQLLLSRFCIEYAGNE